MPEFGEEAAKARVGERGIVAALRGEPLPTQLADAVPGKQVWHQAAFYKVDQ